MLGSSFFFSSTLDAMSSSPSFPSTAPPFQFKLNSFFYAEGRGVEYPSFFPFSCGSEVMAGLGFLLSFLGYRHRWNFVHRC